MPPLARASALLALSFAATGCLFSSTPPEEVGRILYRRETCASCHGFDGEGTPLGPSLRGLSENWTRDELVKFLADPESYRVADPRLDALSTDANNRMTPFDYLSRGQRRDLAAYLLSR